MKATKKLGIWMDHASANIMEYTTEPIKITTINSKFTHNEKEKSINKSENLMHNKEQHQQAEYYKALGETIKKYEEVLLFGPTDAKVELFNILKKDNLFSEIKIEMKQTDKMNEDQQQNFIKDYFSNQLHSL